jgi:hypothetical protein
MLLDKINLCLCETASHKHRLKRIEEISQIIPWVGTTFKFNHCLKAEWMARVLLRLLRIDTPDWQEITRGLLPFYRLWDQGCDHALREEG